MKATLQIGRRFGLLQTETRYKIRAPMDAANLVMLDMAYLDTEQMIILLLDAKGQLVEKISRYQGTCSLQLQSAEVKQRFVQLKVYDGKTWQWVNYPVVCSRYFEQRHRDESWEQQSPTLVLRAQSAELHFPQSKKVEAKQVKDSKLDPELVTVAIDLNVHNLAVITVRQHGSILQTVFVSDHGLDQHRYRHLRHIAKKQWQSGQPVKGSTATGSSGGILIACMRTRPTRWRAALPTCAAL